MHGGDGSGALPRQREPPRRTHQRRCAGVARQAVGLCRQPALQRRMVRGSGADEQGRKTALSRPGRLQTPNGGGPSPRLPRLRRTGRPLRTAQHGQSGQRPLQSVSGVQQGDHLGHLDQLVGQAGRTEIRHFRNPAFAASGTGRIPRPSGAGRRLLHERRQAGRNSTRPTRPRWERTTTFRYRKCTSTANPVSTTPSPSRA